MSGKRGPIEGTVDSIAGTVGFLWDLLTTTPAPPPKSEPDAAPPPRKTIPPVVIVNDETIDTVGEEV